MEKVDFKFEEDDEWKETDMPRDYLVEASSIIFNNKVSLAQLVEADSDRVIEDLLRAMDTAQGMMGPTIRKAATYALGQIGVPRTMVALKSRLENERAPGVKDAMVAAMTAIKLAPEGSVHSQLERRQIIEDVYEGRRQADWS